MMQSGQNCRYCVLGFCVQSELRNPGYSEACRCARLAGLTAAWDDFLDRAEAFGLNEKDAARIWNDRRHPALSAPAVRPASSVAGVGRHVCAPLPDCPYLFSTACLLAMPQCPGLCDMYTGDVNKRPAGV